MRSTNLSGFQNLTGLESINIPLAPSNIPLAPFFIPIPDEKP
jgi:hypothetical protein